VLRSTTLGEGHPHFATSLDNLAGLYREMGDYAAAEPLYRQASDIFRTALGEEHPLFALTLSNLARLCVATARETEALALKKEAEAIYDRMIRQVFSISR
jgi:tetratricopeptide (TPR) repeat protein